MPTKKRSAALKLGERARSKVNRRVGTVDAVDGDRQLAVAGEDDVHGVGDGGEAFEEIGGRFVAKIVAVDGGVVADFLHHRSDVRKRSHAGRIEAIRALGDTAFVQEHLYDCLKDIIDWHIKGTRYGIRAGEDGLLSFGEQGVQLTWMDAKVGDWVVTPRIGKPVEIPRRISFRLAGGTRKPSFRRSR